MKQLTDAFWKKTRQLVFAPRIFIFVSIQLVDVRGNYHGTYSSRSGHKKRLYVQNMSVGMNAWANLVYEVISHILPSLLIALTN